MNILLRPLFIAWLGAFALSACATVDITQAPTQSAMVDPAYAEARNNLLARHRELQDAVVSAGLRDGDAEDATAKALRVLTQGWGDQEARDPVADYIRDARSRASAMRSTFAAVVADDLTRITRRVDALDQASQSLMALAALPPTLSTEIATLEDAMGTTRQASRLANRAILTAYQGSTVPEQVTDAQQMLETRMAALTDHANTLARIQHERRQMSSSTAPVS